MPNTKNAQLRHLIVDRCLSGGSPMSQGEILERVNAELRAQGKPLVKYKSTIVKDIKFISRTWDVELEKVPRGKEYLFKYKNQNFSIFKSALTPTEQAKLKQIATLMKDFTGIPQFDWMDELCNKINLSTKDYSNSKPIVKFMRNPAFSTYRKHFSPLFDYIQNKKAIELTYQRFEAEASKTYVVHPYELMEYEARWYLVGSFDFHPDSLSTFCFDRIVDYKESDVPFRENTITDTDEYFGSMVGLTRPDGAEPQEVLLWVDNSEYPYLKTKPIHKSQKLVREENGGKIISLHAIVNIELMMVLLSYGDFVKILSPTELRQKMKVKTKNMSSFYEE